MVDFSFSQQTINSAGMAVFGAGLSFLAAWFWFSRNAAVRRAEVLAVDHERVLLRVAELETKARLSEQATTPIVTAFQALLVKQLTHADKPEMDELMVKIGPPDVLTADEHARLLVMLHDRGKDMSIAITAGERDAAKILPIVMKMAAEEQTNFEQATVAHNLQLVTIVSVVKVGTPPPEKQEKDE
jgi:hypothetical protein